MSEQPAFELPESESTNVPAPRVHRPSSIPVRAGALACAFAATACASFGLRTPPKPIPEPANAANEERPSQPPLPDPRFASEDDFAVRVITGAVTCTGALIADDRVLTAHHCVSARSARGEIENREVAPNAIEIELGGDVLPWGEVSVRELVVPNCGHAGGNGDLAILVLNRPLRGIVPRAVELDVPPSKGDAVVPIGFGRCADASDGIYRKRRAGTPLSKVDEGRVELEAAICPGDSGGPAISEASGKIVGVVSRGVMDTREASLGPTELARVDTFRALFATAEQVAAGTSSAELPPIECRH